MRTGLIAGHKKRQKERELENRNRRRDIGWASPLIPDLTERDLYRFRATSAIFMQLRRLVAPSRNRQRQAR